jgi:hypothetical protein
MLDQTWHIEKPRGDQFVDPPSGYHGRLKFMNWHGFRVAVSGKVGPYFFNQIESRRKHNRSCIIIVTGSPGDGKSYIALRLAQIFDRNFYVDEDFTAPDELVEEVNKANKKIDEANKFRRAEGKPLFPRYELKASQVVFERQRFLFLIGNRSPLQYGQVIIPDEAQYAMGARRWYEDIQKDLMEAVESVRSRGFIIIIVALHLDLLDTIIRKFVLSYMIHIEDRGLGTVYRLRTPRFESHMRKYRLGQLRLLLPGYEECPNPDCIRCSHLWPNDEQKIGCQNVRARYERRKKMFTGMMSERAERKAAEKAAPSDPDLTTDDMAKVVYENKEKLTYNLRGRISPTSIALIIAEKTNQKVMLSSDKQYGVRKWVEAKYPQIALGNPNSKYGKEEGTLYEDVPAENAKITVIDEDDQSVPLE